jgi:curli production assembly/transport component CsgE
MPPPFGFFAVSTCWLAALLLLASHAASAQTVPGRGAVRPAPAAKKPAQLPAAQVEEALRMLLRADSVNQRRARGPESAGLVLDQTITKLGRDFFELFYNAFEAPAGVLDYTVIILERPGRVGSALIALTVNDVELFETPLPPQYDQMGELAAQAVSAAQGLLLENQRVSRQLESGQRAAIETY